MSPIKITPISMLNLQAKYSTLSNYAQRFLKSQIRSVYFNLEKLIVETDEKLISQNESKLKELGIKYIGQNIGEGIVISKKEYDCHIFSSDGGFLNFNIIRPDNNQVYKHFRVNDKSDRYLHIGDFSDSDAENELSDLLDFIESKLPKVKRALTNSYIPKPLLPEQTTLKTTEKPKENIKESLKNTDINNAGFIGTKEEELINSIAKKLQIVQGLYKRLPDCRTKFEIRSSYKNYLPQPVTNKIGFKNIGPDGESICFFYSSFRKNAHAAVCITTGEGKEIQYVISGDKKSVQKNLPNKYVKSDNSEYRIHVTPDYYTQKEVDESNLNSYLSCLDKEMDLFIEHTQNWFKKREEIKLIKSNYDTATLDEYNDLLDDIHSNFEKYRVKIRKHLRKTDKIRKFKTENNISTKLASRAVKFDNITTEGYDLRLSYPKIKSNTATQLLVMQGDKIKNSFYILDNKLLRFTIKDLNDKFVHYKGHLYYYNNKYLQNSDLPQYLMLLRDKLHSLNEQLDAIIKNRNKHHTKSPKGQI